MRALFVVATLSALALGLASCNLREPPTAVNSPSTLTGTVTRVVDGDTFWLDSRDASIRVFGLDAPEADEAGGSAGLATEYCRYSSGGYGTC